MAQQPIEPIQGGTGARNNNASTINISGNFPLTLTLTGSTGVIVPTSGTLLSTTNTSNYVSSFKTTLSGLTPTAATTGAVTLAGTLGLSSGGTNASLTATTGGLVYGTGTALAVSAAGTANQFVLSGGTGAPTFLSNSTTVDAGSGTATLVIGSPFTFSGTTNEIVTAASGATVTISIAGTYVGQTSITTLGTITSGTWNGTTLAIANGGTGQTNQTAAFDALSPLTTQGDILYYNGTHNVRLGAGVSGQFLQTQGTSANPTWVTLAGSGTVTSVSVATANGFAGTVATPTITPAITIETTVTGILYGNGTAITAATVGEFPTLNQSTTGNAATATNIAGRTANQIPYQTAANTTAFFSAANYGIQIYDSIGAPLAMAGAAGVLQGSTSANPVWTTTPTLTGTNFSGTAASLTVGNATAAVTSTNIAGGAAGSLLYQTAANTTSTLSLGIANYVLTAGSTAPQYVAQSTLSVGSATNLAGGAAGGIPYQTGAGATSFIAAGTNTYVLTMAGGLPSWAAPTGGGSGTVTSVSVTSANGFAGTVATSTTTPAISIFTSVTGILVGNGSSVTAATSSTSFPGYAAGVAGGAAGSLVYQTNSNATTTLALGTTGYILTAGAAAPAYVAPSTLTVGTATNIAGGTAHQMPYQTGAGATAFFSAANYGVIIYSSAGVPSALAGAAGVLQGSASATPVWTTTPTLTGTNFSGTAASLSIGGNAATATTATSATTATNLSGTTVGSIPYQSASATTGYLADVATGSVLVSGGVGVAPAWSTALTDQNMAPDIYTLLWLNI